MTGSTAPDSTTVPPRRPASPLLQRLAELRGSDTAPRPLDARALAALAANPGCRRRALLDGAGVDKRALATALGSPAAFGQSQFAFARGHIFESRVRGDGGAGLATLVQQRSPLGTDGAPLPEPEPDRVRVPELTAAGPLGRVARTRVALAEAVRHPGWTVLHHPLVELEVAGSPVYLEPDAVVVQPDGGWTVVEIKSFPILDGSADPAKVGAAARQAAVYALALRQLADTLRGTAGQRAEDTSAQAVAGADACWVRPAFLLVCPKDFANLPTAEFVDIRKQTATTRRQLSRLTRLAEIAEAVPPGVSFAPDRSAEQLTEAVETVPAAYAPACLASCELAFHCRQRARDSGALTAFGSAVRGELGGLTTVRAVLAAAHGPAGPDGAGHGADTAASPVRSAGPAAGGDLHDPAAGDDLHDPTSSALRRAARLRAEALASRAPCAPGSPTAQLSAADGSPTGREGAGA